MATTVKSPTTSKPLGLVKVEPSKKGNATVTLSVKQKETTSSIQDDWDKELNTPRSKTLLAGMAAKALAEHKAGKTERGGFGK